VHILVANYWRRFLDLAEILRPQSGHSRSESRLPIIALSSTLITTSRRYQHDFLEPKCLPGHIPPRKSPHEQTMAKSTFSKAKPAIVMQRSQRRAPIKKAQQVETSRRKTRPATIVAKSTAKSSPQTAANKARLARLRARNTRRDEDIRRSQTDDQTPSAAVHFPDEIWLEILPHMTYHSLKENASCQQEVSHHHRSSSIQQRALPSGRERSGCCDKRRVICKSCRSSLLDAYS